ncbi:hypothetical protein [Bartonella massiliensis]|nr:hypothetical protein [Bartonella massiliensis]
MLCCFYWCTGFKFLRHGQWRGGRFRGGYRAGLFGGGGGAFMHA